MATPAQLLANRRNARKSTGPRSPEGKAASRFNALKTGIQARSQVIPGEDSAELEQLAADYHLQFQPASPVERFLVDALIAADWQLRRYRTIEARLWEQATAPDSSSLGQAFDRHLPAFTRLNRRLEAVERSYYRALQQLQHLQSQRDEDTEPEEEEVLDLPPIPPSGPELASFSRVPDPCHTSSSDCPPPRSSIS